jgi:hypothetical protein
MGMAIVYRKISPIIGDSASEGFLLLTYRVLGMLHYRTKVTCSAFVVGKTHSNNSQNIWCYMHVPLTL